MEYIDIILPAIVTLLYLKVIKRSIHPLVKMEIVIEIKAMLIFVVLTVLSFLVLWLPMREGIHTYFAKGGLIVSFVLPLYVIWLLVIMKMKRAYYDKSVLLLEKFMGNII